MFSKTFNDIQEQRKQAFKERQQELKKQEKATYEASLELLLNNQEALQAVKNDVLRGIK